MHKPHGNHKPKISNKYIHIKRKVLKHNSKDHNYIREQKRKKKQKKNHKTIPPPITYLYE